MKCCTSSVVNKTDDMLWNVSEEDGILGRGGERDEGTD